MLFRSKHWIISQILYGIFRADSMSRIRVTRGVSSTYSNPSLKETISSQPLSERLLHAAAFKVIHISERKLQYPKYGALANTAPSIAESALKQKISSHLSIICYDVVHIIEWPWRPNLISFCWNVIKTCVLLLCCRLLLTFYYIFSVDARYHNNRWSAAVLEKMFRVKLNLNRLLSVFVKITN